MEKVLEYLNEHKEEHVNNLREAVAIPSVSAWPSHRHEVIRMIKHVGSKLESLDYEVEYCDLGNQKLPDGSELKLPPVILAAPKNFDVAKKTVCVYGHCDVQPAQLTDGWNTEPFVLTEKDGKMYGRGSTDDKGPVIGWLNVLTAFNKTGTELPVNVMFCFEGMEESNSDGLDELLLERKDTFFDNVDCICISDSNWMSYTRPCITYGLRGIAYFYAEVECADKDMHSGVYGGSVHEAMSDLIYVMNQLVDVNAKLVVPKIYDQVAPLTDEELASYDNVDFDLNEYAADIKAPKLVHDNKADCLMSRWRYPSLSLHGIEGAFYEPGGKTVIPGKVIGKFSIRLVPNMTPDVVEKLVTEHLESKWKERNSPNRFRVLMVDGSKPWVSELDHPSYEAAKNAFKTVFNVDPDYTREGGSIPITLTFQEALGMNVLLLPMGGVDDCEHSQNEKLDREKYFKGMELFVRYFYELPLAFALT